MTMQKDEIQSQLHDAWMQNFDSLEKSVDLLENYIEKAKGMAGVWKEEASCPLRPRWIIGGSLAK